MTPRRNWIVSFACSLCVFILLGCNLTSMFNSSGEPTGEAVGGEVENPTETGGLDEEDLEQEILEELEGDEEPLTPQVSGETPNPPVNTLTTTFQDADGFYSLQYPQGWVAQRSGSQQQFCVDSSATACFSVSLSIKQVYPEVFKELETRWFEANLADYQELDEKWTSVSGLQAIRVEQSYSWNNTPTLGFTLLTVRNRIGFELMAWAPKGDYPNLEATFNEIAGSFILKPQAQSPLYKEWSSYQSSNLTLYYLPGTWIEGNAAGIAKDHEWAKQQIEQALSYQLPPERHINIYLYATPESLYQSTARDSGFAISDFSEVHSLWQSANDHQTLGHEMTHVITHWAAGEPSEALLGEGVAVCLDQSGRDYHQIGKEWKDANGLAPLNEMLGGAWFNQDSTLAYQESGSFACYLLEAYGAEKFLRLYQEEDFVSGLSSVLNTDLTQVEQDWYAWLDKR